MHAKVDTEAEQGLAAAAGITSIPTLMAFREGILVFAQPGALPKESLEKVVQAVEGAGHGRRARQVAEHRAAQGNGEHDHDHEHDHTH